MWSEQYNRIIHTPILDMDKKRKKERSMLTTYEPVTALLDNYNIDECDSYTPVRHDDVL